MLGWFVIASYYSGLTRNLKDLIKKKKKKKHVLVISCLVGSILLQPED